MSITVMLRTVHDAIQDAKKAVEICADSDVARGLLIALLQDEAERLRVEGVERERGYDADDAERCSIVVENYLNKIEHHVGEGPPTLAEVLATALANRCGREDALELV
jgi:hypothetical protein